MPVGRPVLSKPQFAAGQRRRLVLIQQAVESAGASGFPVTTWTTLASDWMSRRDTRADERYAKDQPTSFTETSWNMPYRADMDPELVDVPRLRRLVYEGRTYDIRSASPIGWKQAIELVTLAQTKVA